MRSHSSAARKPASEPMIQPGMTYFPEIGESYPTCWLFSRMTADCTTEPVKIRSSFLLIDPKHPFVWNTKEAPNGKNL